MDHDTRMVFLARGITNTSRGGPLGATNEKKIRFDLSKNTQEDNRMLSGLPIF